MVSTLYQLILYLIGILIPYISELKNNAFKQGMVKSFGFGMPMGLSISSITYCACLFVLVTILCNIVFGQRISKDCNMIGIA
jgi:hypothetical protein